MDAIFEEFMNQEYCTSCIVICSGVSVKCKTANDMRKMLRWKNKKAVL